MPLQPLPGAGRVLTPLPVLPLLLSLLLLGGLGLGLCSVAGDSVGVNATHVAVGMTGPFTGLQAEYGARIAAGLRTAFAEANAAGGVQARNLTLITMDDGYLVSRSVANFPALSSQALLLAGVYGADINTALLPLEVAAGVPHVGPFSGSLTIRTPFHQEVINVRASIPDEMVVLASILVEKLRVHRVACLYQNDSFGQTSLSSVTAALNYVGLQLMVAAAYQPGSTAIEPALETIAGYPLKAQAVVMASLETQSVKFIRLFRQDNRTDPDCNFLFYSGGATSAFANKTNRQDWGSFYFTQVVPPLDTPDLPIVSQYQSAAAQYLPPGMSPDLITFQAYLAGRLTAHVLRGIPGAITRQSFLDELYNTRLYVFGGLLLGLYGRNFVGCETAVSNSSIGLRTVFPATLHPATGVMHYNASLGSYSYSLTKLSYPVTNIVRPLLFGQLLPTDDPVWRWVAEAIGQALLSAFAALNAAGGVDGRPVELIQRYYAGDPAPYAAAVADRYELLALVGSVVNRSQSLQPYAPAQIGTYQTDPPAEYTAYNYTEVQVQASLPLELMALAAFAYKLGAPVHLRAPNTAAGQTALQTMVKSLTTLQQQPASSRTYTSTAEALEGLSSSATVIAVGSDADVQAWFVMLAILPQLRLLVPSQRAAHLLATLNMADYSQASRVHYPYMFNTSALPAAAAAAADVRDAAAHGQLLGGVLSIVLAKTGNASMAYTTPLHLLGTWYGSQYKFGGVTLGPYYSTACSAIGTDCECNEGVRQVTVLTLARQEQPIAFSYAASNCRVAYKDLVVAAERGLGWIGGVIGAVVGAAALGALGWRLARRGERDNSAAPKSGKEPFCVLFTDIQASTHLWATIPDVMATALHVHHSLIRRLIAKHRLYEVKTIGDSFMCASKSPAPAVEFALALQWELFEHDWGTDRIDAAYAREPLPGEGEAEPGKPAAGTTAWNGLRVRVGVHYGAGDVVLDPVTKGYDYYGTVVNTAARVEAVCHGGQVGITQAVYDALGGEFPGAVLSNLGLQLLRGLPGPLHLYQLVPTELSRRTFPPLRLEHAAVEVPGGPPTEAVGHGTPGKATVAPLPGVPCRAEEDYEALSAVESGNRSPSSRSPTNRRMRASVPAAVPPWADAHPMVRAGLLSAEDLHLRYLTVQKALATLLETQTQRVRDASLRAYCERLHVRYFGSDGASLEETLGGLVQRVLPAALGAVGPAPPGRPESSSLANSGPALSTSCSFRPIAAAGAVAGMGSGVSTTTNGTPRLAAFPVMLPPQCDVDKAMTPPDDV